jgi:hypothetical protein
MTPAVVGPRKNCPACGAGMGRHEHGSALSVIFEYYDIRCPEHKYTSLPSRISGPKYCDEHRPLPIPVERKWWQWGLLPVCAVTGPHTHQECFDCGCRWINQPKDGALEETREMPPAEPKSAYDWLRKPGV